jgi:hypothetical protein
MAQVVSLRSLIAEAWVRSEFHPCAIVGGKSGTGVVLSEGILVFPCVASSDRSSILIH